MPNDQERSEASLFGHPECRAPAKPRLQSSAVAPNHQPPSPWRKAVLN